MAGEAGRGVARLDSAVGKIRKVRVDNPERDPKKPCVYVGMTGLTPEKRFANHKAGIKDAPLVKRYGIRLLPELYGKTVFRDAAGRTMWTATTSGGQTTTYRDAAGRIQRTASPSGSSITFRDSQGRTTGTVQPARSSATARDASGRTIGTTTTTGGKQTVATKDRRH